MEVYFYSNIGKRQNNEDYCLVGDGVFIVCDGVGGANKGEVASEIVANQFYEMILNQQINLLSAQNAAYHTHQKLLNYLKDNPQNKGMASTLACLVCDGKTANIIHLGDSRVFYFSSKNQSVWNTIDHSHVMELVVSGAITIEEARRHPMKNVITKAFMAEPDIEFDKPSYTELTQLEPGDIFIICSDGFIESWSNEQLQELIFDNQYNTNQKFTMLQQEAIEFSNDNNTAILVKI